MGRWNWKQEQLDQAYLAWHEQARRDCRREILQMTHLVDSGHPGGSLSSLDFYLVLYAHANIDPKNPWQPNRDRIVVSHGHTSPGVYSVLARLGFFPPQEVISSFRRTSNVFEGHIEREVPGVEWTTGNLGQGLSAACGMALANQLKGIDAQVFVPMGDGEQQKGQIAEARRFAVKYKLHRLTAIVDRNRLQIGGNTDEIMPQDVAAGWKSDGWVVQEIDGHDPVAIHRAVRTAILDTAAPHVIIANTVMGKGVSFIENLADYHGKALNAEQYARAAKESGEPAELWDLAPLQALVAAPPKSSVAKLPHPYPKVVRGTARTYGTDQKTDNRSAFGTALAEVAQASASGGATPVVVFDCDLEGSVKTGAFRKSFPTHFIQGGIQEHNTAAAAGALSVESFVSVFADFGVFGVAETYNQHRLTDINHGNIKLVCTHVGLDVGEDGKTHQSIDYVGVLRNIFGMEIIVPADPNQTDRAVRYALSTPGMMFVGMGRSKLPAITREDGTPFFAGDYEFRPGAGDWIRRGTRGAVVAMGTPTGRALVAVDRLRAQGVDVALAHVATPGRIDAEFLDELAAQPFLITVEDHSIRTGLGQCLAAALFERGHVLPHHRLGVQHYCPSGDAESVYATQNLHAAGIERTVVEFGDQVASRQGAVRGRA
ncbi:MAG: transketolase [Planctomycetota bacterium]